ncbi:hypothetical protein TRFO_14917 [Tritrichomonas foetus]|uniref:BEACH domain-containing protein n=1 Tax=Tritrichomonas foetus TaxID=1144522 RepID=A0A1J4KU14_9EUKA|nr:hypothetical protein TRFO_14917 [Tritrichomonas foetus]|eukprot:OHT14626.1 hypothetical protein TRFO_14917 [Tritrichomonas foetus]
MEEPRGSSIFSFHIDCYNLLKENDAKLQYLKNAMLTFIKKDITKSTLLADDEVQKVKDFLSVLPFTFEFTVPQLLDEIMTVVPIMSAQIFSIPECERYVEIIPTIIEKAIEKNEMSENCLLFFNFLFSENKICEKFVEFHFLDKVIIQFVVSKKFKMLSQLLPHLRGQKMSDSFLQPDSYIELLRIFEFLFGEIENNIFIESIDEFNNNSLQNDINESMNENMKHNDIENIVLFLFDIVQAVSKVTPNIIEMINNDGYFDRINKLFRVSQLVMFYKKIITCSDTKVKLNNIIYNIFKAIYRNCQNETIQMKILKFFSNFFSNLSNTEEKYTISDLEKVFSLDDWIIPTIFQNSEMLSSFSSVAFSCNRISPQSLLKPIDTIIEIVFDNNKITCDTFLNNDIIMFFAKLLTNSCVNEIKPYDSVLLQKLFMNLDNNTVIECLHSYEFYTDFLFQLFSKQRNQWPTESSIVKLIEISKCIESSSSLKFNTDFRSFISNNYTPGLLFFFINNLNNLFYQNLFLDTLDFNKMEFPKFFQIANCSSLISSKVDQFDEFIFPLFEIISRAEAKYRDYFFEDWLLTNLTKDSSLFSLIENNKDIIRNLIVPLENDYVIRLPTLLPFIKDHSFVTKDYFNLYLMGRYSLSVLCNLNLPIENIPYLDLIVKVYIHPSDFFFLIENYHNFINTNVTKSLIKGKTCFEFHRNLLGYVTIDDYKNIHFQKLRFSIILFDKPSKPIPIIRFNNIMILKICNEKFMVNLDSLLEFESNKKYDFEFILAHDNHSVDILINNNLAMKIDDQNHICINSFGCENFESPISFIMFNVKYQIFDDENHADDIKIVNFKNNNFSSIFQAYSLSSLFSDFNYTHELIICFEQEKNPQKSEFLLNILCLISDITIKPIDHRSFLEFLLIAIQSRIESITSSWMKLLFFNILREENMNERTMMLIDFLMNYEIWSHANSSVLAEHLNFMALTFSNCQNSVLNISKFFEFNVFRYLMFLASFHSNKPIFLESLKSFLKSLSKLITNEENIRDVFSVVTFSHMIHLPKGNLNNIDILQVFSSYSQISQPQVIFAEIALEIEKSKGINIFTPQMQLQLSFTLPPNIAFYYFIKVLNNMNGNNYHEFLPSLFLAATRFSYFSEIWSIVIARAMNENDEEGYLFIPIVLALIFSLFNHNNEHKSNLKASINYAESHKKMACNLVLDNMSAKNAQTIFNYPIILPYFIVFLNGGHFQLPSITIEKTKNQILVNKLHNNFNNFLSKFAELCQKSFLIDDECLEGFSDFASDLICKMIVVVNNNSSNPIYSRTVLDFVGSYAFPTLCSKVFLKTLENMRKKDSKIFPILSESIIISCFRNVDLLRKTFFFQSLIQLLIKSPSIIHYFSDIFVLFYHTFSDEDRAFVTEFIFDFYKYFKFSKPIYLIDQILRMKIPPYFPHITQLFQSLKKSLKKNKSYPFLKEKYEKILQLPNLDELLVHMNSVFLEYYNKFKNQCQINGIPLNFPESIVKFWFNNTVNNTISCYDSLLDFIKFVTEAVSKYEEIKSRHFAFQMLLQSQKQKEFSVKSYRIFPSSLPGSCPSYTMPSIFPILSPDEKDGKPIWPSFKPVTQSVIFGIEFDSKTIQIPSLFPNELYKYSFSLLPTKTMSLFTNRFPESENMANCIFIRCFCQIPSIFVKAGNRYFIITDAKLENESSINLLELNNEHISFYESILLNEFHNYFLFCGHFVIQLKEDDILYVKKTLFSANPNAYEFYCYSSGTFIVAFDCNYNFPLIQNISIELDALTEAWENGKISSFKYLNLLNFKANRSFIKISEYPIFPRTLIDLTSNNYAEEDNIRNFWDTLEKNCDNETINQQMILRFETQHFHHSENFSNAMNVSNVFCRLDPFCCFQWTVNDGWDHGSRNFVSIPSTYSIKAQSKTFYEMMPEFFCFPEIFMNLNNFVLPNGTKLNCEYPPYCQNSAIRMIEYFRNSLETNLSRCQINNWFDLAFGFKLSGNDAIESFNLFNPLSYIDDVVKYEDDKSKWIQTCGSVPKQLFQIPHLQSKTVIIDEPESIQFHYSCDKALFNRLNQSKSKYFQINKFRSKIEQVSVDFLNTTNKIKKRVKMLYRKNIISSYLIEQQMLCVTACLNEIVIWSFANGMIVKVIDFCDEKVTALYVDEELLSFFIGSHKTLRQFSISGNFVREITFEKSISSLKTFGCGFSVFDRLIAVGFQDGAVVLLRIDLKSGEFVIQREERLSFSPICDIFYESNMHDVLVFDNNILF